MSNSEELIKKAEERGRAANLPYRGAVTPKEAAELLAAQPGARIVDVRSKAEWTLVGRIPDAIEVEFKLFPEWKPNPAFVDDLQRQLRLDDHVLFICRSGVRSDNAARLLAAEGFKNVYNVLEGFEGDVGPDKKRNVNGWKNSGLPWYQS